MEGTVSPLELLQFYVDSGVDESLGDESINRFLITETNAAVFFQSPDSPAAPRRTSPLPTMPAMAPAMSAPPEMPIGTIEALADARARAAEAKTLDELRTALDEFPGLSIKRTATQMVFSDGRPDARIMVIGEAPGADEDRIGRPFVGLSGQLLDRMLAAIGLDRTENVYITNIINWRPPGNRNPSDSEIALSIPFVERHIELINPDLLLFVGGVSAKALFNTSQGITRLRGKWNTYRTPKMERDIPAMAMFHPAYLLRSPAQKGLAWADLLQVRARLQELPPRT